MKKKLPLVAIIGRVNVGKSTLFNKFIEEHKALISKVPGTTRDLNFGVCEWQGRKFEVVDTGGIFESKLKTQLTEHKEKSIEKQVETKAREILDRADLILFLVDSKTGILKHDRLISQFIKKLKKPRVLVANKIDKTKSVTPGEFEKLGLGEPVGIAAASGVGIGDLLDIVLKKLKFKGKKARKIEVEKNITHVSIVGRPNVGKSSLLNSILGEEKVIVSPVPHTTREPQDTVLEYKNNTIELVDTAGIRRKSKVKAKTLESAGIAMSIKALKKSDIALFVLDISESLTAQDAQLAGLIVSSGVSLIFVANKYDLLSKKQKNKKTKKQDNNEENNKNLTKELTDYIYGYFPFLTWAPIIYTSADTGRNVQKVLPLVLEIKSAREKKIDKEELNDFIKYLMKKMPPPKQAKRAVRTLIPSRHKKSRAFISKTVQVDAPRPIFEINVTNIAKIPESYLRYLENNIRKRFGFDGTPIKLRVIRDRK